VGSLKIGWFDLIFLEMWKILKKLENRVINQKNQLVYHFSFKIYFSIKPSRNPFNKLEKPTDKPEKLLGFWGFSPTFKN
jgi:hypothetical protein